MGRKDRVLWGGPSRGASASGYWGALLYLLGALAFNVTTATDAAYPRGAPHAAAIAAAAFAVVGSIGCGVISA